ncbi:MAG: DMT family transporter [Rhodobacteraceae bacterium]|nr:DMT family transporter [Paracoccaceae bacterium]
MTRAPFVDYALLALLALLWGSSYLFLKIAVVEIPPLTLIAARVTVAAVVLGAVLAGQGKRLPRQGWGLLFLQSILNSSGAWTLLAWGQQRVGAGLAAVLNSTSPVFVVLAALILTRHEPVPGRRLAGAVLGLAGVAAIVGVGALGGLGSDVVAQLACLGGAILYAAAAIHGRKVARFGALETALGTMLCATATLLPLAFALEDPLALRPSWTAVLSVLALGMLCTALALLIYFRLVRTLGPLGVASQAYLRAGIGVLLGVVLLGERPEAAVWAGVAAVLAGVVLINIPKR